MFNSFLCCFSLELGSRIVAGIFAVTRVLFIAYESLDVVSIYKDTWSPEEESINEEVMLAIVELMGTVLFLVCSFLLIIGLFKRHTGLILISLTSEIALLSPTLFTLVLQNVLYLQHHPWSNLVAFAVLLGCGVYSYLILFSYLKQLIRIQEEMGQEITIPCLVERQEAAEKARKCNKCCSEPLKPQEC